MKVKYSVIIWVTILNQVSASSLVGKSINNFVTRIDKILTQDLDQTTVLCPFNLHLGLSLLLQGAAGDTASELSALLGLPGPGDGWGVADDYRGLLDNLTSESFKTWTCMIPGEDFDLSQSFVDTAYANFKTGAAGASQTPPGGDVTLKYCNNIGSRPRTTKLQIFSKAGFNSRWRKSFPTAEENEFYVKPGKKVRTMTMTMTDKFAYKEDKGINAKILKLDFKDDGWSMLLVLPSDRNAALSSLQSKIAESSLTSLTKDLKETELEVSIPKFSANAFNFHRDIKFLEKMGASKLFSNDADFTSLSTGGKMHLSHVLIEAFITINETGTLAGSGADFLAGGGDELVYNPRPRPATTKAAVSTTAATTTTSGPTSGFICNRPFLFYIVGPGDVFLYNGKIVDPTNKMARK